MRKLLVLALVGAVSVVLATQAFAASQHQGRRQLLRARKRRADRHREEGLDGHVAVRRPQPAHTSPSAAGPVKFHSSAKSSGTFKKKLTRAGTYRIYCTIHGAADQSMKLVVK